MTDELRLGPHTTLLGGPDTGKYPYGNPLLIRGPELTVLIDSAVDVPIPDGVDLCLLSHYHEDHTCGLTVRHDLPVQIHGSDLEAVQSVEAFFRISGYGGDEEYIQSLAEKFHHGPIERATEFAANQEFDLGGGVVIRVVHLPGHTPGHSGFFIEPDGVLFIADIDLTSFGPFYGDACSSLTDFRASIDACATITAHGYSTYHQKRNVDSPDTFHEALAKYRRVFDEREERLLALLTEPTRIDDIPGNGVVYRPGRIPSYAYQSELVMAQLHLDELVGRGKVRGPDELGRYQAV